MIQTPPSHLDRRRFAAVALLMLLAATTLVATSNANSSYRRRAYLARALKVDDSAHLHYVKEAHAELIDEGAATGTVPGRVQVGFNVGATVAATFTIYTHEGTIIGHGTGTLHESTSASDVYLSFGGTLAVAHGTGRYAHAHGQGGFYGTIDRKNYAITIQTTGTLTY